jgi:hypothetical protein
MHLNQVQQAALAAITTVPLAWRIVEQTAPFTVCLDTHYGRLALFEGDTLAGIGKLHIIPDNNKCVVLDKDYYGVPKYIWQ